MMQRVLQASTVHHLPIPPPLRKQVCEKKNNNKLQHFFLTSVLLLQSPFKASRSSETQFTLNSLDPKTEFISFPKENSFPKKSLLFFFFDFFFFFDLPFCFLLVLETIRFVWQEHKDPKTSKAYFSNLQAKNSVWKLPEYAFASALDDSLSKPALTSAATFEAPSTPPSSSASSQSKTEKPPIDRKRAGSINNNNNPISSPSSTTTTTTSSPSHIQITTPNNESENQPTRERRLSNGRDPNLPPSPQNNQQIDSSQQARRKNSNSSTSSASSFSSTSSSTSTSTSSSKSNQPPPPQQTTAKSTTQQQQVQFQQPSNQASAAPSKAANIPPSSAGKKSSSFTETETRTKDYTLDKRKTTTEIAGRNPLLTEGGGAPSSPANSSSNNNTNNANNNNNNHPNSSPERQDLGSEATGDDDEDLDNEAEDFEDFEYASNSIEPAEKSDQIAFTRINSMSGVGKSSSPIATNPVPTTASPNSTFLAKSTMLSDTASVSSTGSSASWSSTSSKKDSDQKRSDTDDMIEEDLFSSAYGEIHVLATMKSKRKKEDRHVVIARDWCGAYFILIVNDSGKTILTKKSRVIHEAYPLISDARTDKVEAATKDTIKFSLIIDEVEVALTCQSKNKNLLDKYLKDIMLEMYEGKTDEQVLMMRMCTIDLCRTFYNPFQQQQAQQQQQSQNQQTQQQQNQNQQQNQLSSSSEIDMIFDKIIASKYAKGENPFSTLRDCMMYLPRGRDIVIEKLIVHANSNSFNFKKPEAWLKIYEETIFCLLPTERLDLKFEILDLLDKFEKNAPRAEIQQQVALLKNQTRTVFKVLASWKGRNSLADVPFGEVFFNPKKVQSKTKALLKAREAIAKTRLGQGVLFVSIVFTKQGEMLVDAKDNPPNIVFRQTYNPNFDLDESKDLQWIYLLSGKNWTSAVDKVRNAVTSLVSSSSFVKDFVRVVQTMKDTLKMSDLGCLYDRAIHLRDFQTMLLVSVLQIDEKDKNSVVGSSDYQWKPIFSVEHRMYLKYSLIEEKGRIETLSDAFETGSRWIKSCVDYARCCFEPLSSGVYLGYLRVRRGAQSASQVMVRADSRGNIPTAQLLKGSQITPIDWKWIQGVRIREERKEPMIPPGTDLDWEVPIERCKTFQQKFYRAFLELKSQIGESLGKLFDHEPIELDLKGNVKLILFVDKVSDSSLPNSGKFIWRSLELFEHLNSACYMSELSEQYKAELLNFYDKNPLYLGSYEQGTALTADELFRTENQTLLSNFFQVEKERLCLRWLSDL